MKSRLNLALVLVAIVGITSFLFWGGVRRIDAQQPELVAVKVPRAPTIDGTVEGLWNQAKPLTIKVAGGANQGSHEVRVRAVYSGDSVYFLAEWNDKTQSLRRFPWQKQADGSWKQLITGEKNDSNAYYEDKLAMIWDINITGFQQAGCFAACHAGESPSGSPYGNKYTPNPGELADIWHWKSVRTNPVGQIDDQYLDSSRYDREKAAEAGRHSDPKESGGYSDNKTKDGKVPPFAQPGNKPAPPYWITDAQKMAFDDGKYKANDEVPGIIVSPIKGDRGDIAGKGVYQNGRWTLEWGRKLVTGSKFDVQFSDLAKAYYFGVAIFDDAQVRHSFQSGSTRLMFRK